MVRKSKRKGGLGLPINADNVKAIITFLHGATASNNAHLQDDYIGFLNALLAVGAVGVGKYAYDKLKGKSKGNGNGQFRTKKH